MKKVNLYVSQGVYDAIDPVWIAGQNMPSSETNALSMACMEIAAEDRQCRIYPFSELEKYPDIISHFGITGPPVLIIYETETQRAEALMPPITKQRIIDAYNNHGKEGRGGFAITNGSGINPFGLFNIPWWIILIALAAITMQQHEKK